MESIAQESMKKIAVIGGGTGSFVVLSGLKTHDVDLTSIVTMMDSGGSTGRLRDQLGVLPPGDLRQCLVALSDAPDLWRKLFLYRFTNGDLEGHNFGNIFISALEKVCPDYDTVLETANYVLKTKGRVLPVTYEKATLCVEYENGKVVKGESNIDENKTEHAHIKNAYLEPKIKTNKHVIEYITNADLVVIGPGDLYTSIIPVLLVDGVKEALKNTQAQIVYIMNLMTKSGQTSSYTAKQFLADISRYIGREPEYLIMHSGSIPKFILDWYNKHNEIAVKNDLNGSYTGVVVERDLIDRSGFNQSEADKVTRSILRHDAGKLSKAIMSIAK
ncbi:YvcK family protein [Candidatus Woesebacteria bacterium]|nr:YvcK family protein [Candidatus Woesebacteria bacterium]